MFAFRSAISCSFLSIIILKLSIWSIRLSISSFFMFIYLIHSSFWYFMSSSALLKFS
jgi:hypothetical protein